jgi:hypothetical protein
MGDTVLGEDLKYLCTMTDMEISDLRPVRPLLPSARAPSRSVLQP